MLLKIYTHKNSLVVIENIEDIEIHDGTFWCDTVQEVIDGGKGAGDVWQPIGPEWRHPVHGEATPRPPATFFGDSTPTGVSHHPVTGFPVRFTDYRKDGMWHRIATSFFTMAYLCNDNGKTIERINEAGRSAA